MSPLHSPTHETPVEIERSQTQHSTPIFGHSESPLRYRFNFILSYGILFSAFRKIRVEDIIFMKYCFYIITTLYRVKT